jgi:uracil-DNA glycosylase family 4
VIGDFPSSIEDRVGRPFCDEAGKYAEKLVRSHWNGPIAMDNALRCPKGREKLPVKSVEKCRGYLAQTIQEVRPTRILCLGNVAMLSLFGESLDPLSMRKAVSWLVEPDPVTGFKVATPVFLLLSPDAALRNRFLRWWFEEDLKWALTVDQEKIPKPPIHGRCNVVETEEDAVLAEQACQDAGGFTYDVENVGRIGNKFLKLVSVSCTPYGTDDAFVWTQDAIEADVGARSVLANMLTDPDLPKSGSFLKHDHEVSSQVLGIQIRGTDVDIRLQRKALEARASGRLEHMGYLVGMGGHKLEMEEAISKQCRAIGDGRKKTKKAHAFLPGTVDEIYGEAIHSTLEPRVFAYGLVNRGLLHRYNALDTIVSERCRVRFAHEIGQVAPVRHIWNSVIKDTVEAVSQVESWGVPIDTVAMENFGTYTRQRITEISRHFEQYGANPGSPKQMAALLYDTLKLPCARRSDDGQGATDEESLEEIEDKHPIVGKLLEFRTYDKLRGTYAEGLLQHVRDDWRIHPSIDVAGATTGRTSSKEPNLQNQPRAKDDDFAMARRVFAAPQGKQLVMLDYCVAPWMRVLTQDLRWIPASAIKVGDKLIGFGEELGRTSKLCPTDVTSVRTITRPCYEVVTTKGTIVSSAEHLWVTRKYPKPPANRKWVRTDDLKVGMSISWICAPWETDTSWNGAWMAGFLDGEGWCSDRSAGFGQKDGPLLRHALKILRAGGVTDVYDNRNRNGCHSITPKGTCAGMRMIGMYRPMRLLANSKKLWDGRQPWSKRSDAAVIKSIRYVGEQPVRAIRTTTQTFITEGFLSHNSQLEYRVAAMLSGDEKMKQIFREGKDVHRATAQLIARDFFKVAPEDVTEEMRDVTKQFNFGTIYNMQVRTLAARMGISLQRAEQIQHAIMGEFTDLREFIASCLAEAEKTGYTWTWWAGQRARRRSLYQIGNVLYNSDDKKAKAAVRKARNGAFNTRVQGTASDFCVKSLIELVRWIQMDEVDAKLILPIHDALLFEVGEDAVDEVCLTAAETMLSWDSLDVPFAVDIKVGKTLGDVKKYKVAA